MAIPLLVDDAVATIEWLNRLLALLKRKNDLPENLEVFDLPDGPVIPLFQGMPPWAFSGNSTQSSDVGGTQTNEAIEQGRKRQESAAKGALEYFKWLQRDTVNWWRFISDLNKRAASSNKKIAYQARMLLARLHQWGLI